MVEKIAGFRDKIKSGKNDRKFEINSMNMLNDQGSVEFRGPELIAYDPGLDEASYRSWVEKFKEVSPLNNDTELNMRSRRSLPEEKLLKADAARKKSMEKKVSKWEALGYYSLSVSCPMMPTETDVFSVSGAVHFVYGDCTHPSRDSPSDHAIIFSCVDESGNWGRGGMFDALTRLSANISDAYEKAHEFGDLHLGDMHLIPLKEDSDDGASGSHVSQWVALAVVQSYNPRRNVPRGDISIPHLEECLSKASYSTVQNSASIHMPRIGYQDGSNRSEWYTVERLLRKYAALYDIQIFVYYYRRSG